MKAKQAVHGVASVRAYLEQGLKVGLGSDVAGGTTENMFKAITHAIQASKLRWRLLDDFLKPLTVQQRLERMIYCSDDRQIYAKYVAGKKLFAIPYVEGIIYLRGNSVKEYNRINNERFTKRHVSIFKRQ